MTQDPEENYQKRMARQYPKHVPGHFQPKGWFTTFVCVQFIQVSYLSKNK